MGGEGGEAGAQPVGRMESGWAVQPREQPRHQPQQEEEEEEEEEPGSLERMEKSREKQNKRTNKNKKNPNEKSMARCSMEICGQMSREERQGRREPAGAVWAEVMVGTRCPGGPLGGQGLSGGPWVLDGGWD